MQLSDFKKASNLNFRQNTNEFSVTSNRTMRMMTLPLKKTTTQEKKTMENKIFLQTMKG